MTGGCLRRSQNIEMSPLAIQARTVLFYGPEISGDLRDFRVADFVRRHGRHVALRLSDQLEGSFIAPLERHEAGTDPASSLGAVAPAAFLFVNALAGVLGGAANRPHAGGDQQRETS
jgi:hypothetical protein